MQYSHFQAHLATMLALALVSPVAALTPPPLYRLDVAGFQQGADYGLVTGFNNSAQATYVRISFGVRAYWWTGSQEIQLLPNASNAQATVLDLADNGTAVGHRLNGNTYQFAMLWNNGVPQDIGTMGGLESSAEAINDNGVIAGWSDVAGGGSKHLFTWQNGFTDRGVLPPSLTCCHDIEGINNSNQIVGHDSGSLLRGWLYSGGQFTSLPDLTGTFDSTPRDINDSGLVVGASYPHQNNTRPVTWTAGQVQALPMPPGAFDGEARSVNDLGEIVGMVSLPDAIQERKPYAMLWKDGLPFVLRDLVTNLGDWELRNAEHINDRGQIEILAYSNTNSWKRVILTPIPEPGTLLLALIAILPALRRTPRGVRK